MAPSSLLHFPAYWFSFLLAFSGIVITIQRFARRRLLDAQSSLESIRQLSWSDFERLVGEAYRRQGYQVEERGGSGADGGVDLVLRRSGEKVFVQCKRWRNRTVGVSVVRELYGAMAAEGATAGIVATVGRYTADAMEFARGKHLTLVDGEALLALVRSGQGSAASASPVTTAAEALATNTAACPACGAEMVRRTARRGANAGGEFWGCSQYPRCRGTRNGGEQAG
nr:restriction endonuclease [Capsulimonas corticalis]